MAVPVDLRVSSPGATSNGPWSWWRMSPAAPCHGDCRGFRVGFPRNPGISYWRPSGVSGTGRLPRAMPNPSAEAFPGFSLIGCQSGVCRGQSIRCRTKSRRRPAFSRTWWSVSFSPSRITPPSRSWPGCAAGRHRGPSGPPCDMRTAAARHSSPAGAAAGGREANRSHRPPGSGCPRAPSS